LAPFFSFEKKSVFCCFFFMERSRRKRRLFDDNAADDNNVTMRHEEAAKAITKMGRRSPRLLSRASASQNQNQKAKEKETLDDDDDNDDNEQDGRQSSTSSKRQRSSTPSSLQSESLLFLSHDLRDAGQQLERRLKSVLAQPLLRRWCTYEWFYSNIDYAYLHEQNEFKEILESEGIAVQRATRAEWRRIRANLGKPRRLSKAFLAQERRNLELNRQRIRLVRDGGQVDPPMLHIPAPLPANTEVLCVHPSTNDVLRGVILEVHGHSSVIRFDDGSSVLVPDIYIMPHAVTLVTDDELDDGARQLANQLQSQQQRRVSQQRQQLRAGRGRPPRRRSLALDDVDVDDAASLSSTPLAEPPKRQVAAAALSAPIGGAAAKVDDDDDERRQSGRRAQRRVSMTPPALAPSLGRIPATPPVAVYPFSPMVRTPHARSSVPVPPLVRVLASLMFLLDRKEGLLFELHQLHDMAQRACVLGDAVLQLFQDHYAFVYFTLSQTEQSILPLLVELRELVYRGSSEQQAAADDHNDEDKDRQQQPPRLTPQAKIESQLLQQPFRLLLDKAKSMAQEPTATATEATLRTGTTTTAWDQEMNEGSQHIASALMNARNRRAPATRDANTNDALAHRCLTLVAQMRWMAERQLSPVQVRIGLRANALLSLQPRFAANEDIYRAITELVHRVEPILANNNSSNT
jgi:DIRP